MTTGIAVTLTVTKTSPDGERATVTFRANGIAKGDVVILWSESRPGWVAALWAACWMA